MYKEYNAYLTTLDAFKVFQRDSQNAASWNESNEAIAVGFIQQASQEIIDSILWRLPLPYLKTVTLRRSYFADHPLIREAYEWRLAMPDDLLSITTLTWIGTALTATTQYRLADANRHPNREIAIDPDALSTILPANFDESISVVGIFGYVPQWNTAWVDSSDTVQDDPLTASATTLAVSDDTNFEEYQYIRIESEYLLITSIDADTEVLTVERDALGTTAASHVTTTQIDTFVQQGTIQRAATEYAAYLYKTKDQLGQQVEIYDGAVRVSNGLDQRLYNSLLSHRRYVGGTV